MKNIYITNKILGDRDIEDDLMRRGYIILCKNIVIDGNKLDLIAQKDGEIVGICIKTRIGDFNFSNLTQPEFSLLSSVIERFISGSERLRSKPWRLDILNISLDRRGKPISLSHIENFRPSFVSRETCINPS